MSPVPTPHLKRWGLTALAAAALAVPLLATPGATSAVGAAPGDPTIRLDAPAAVTLTSYDGVVYDQLPFRLEVTDGDLEIWSQRADDYLTPPTSVAKLASGDVPLPTQNTVGSLARFLTLTAVPAGRPDATPIVRRYSACFGESQRITPDAVFANHYPGGCSYQTYALGAVQGIPAGWSSSLLPWDTRMRLRPGQYDVTLSISAGYADALGISAEDRSVDFDLTLRNGDDGCRGCRERGTDPRLSPNRHEPDPTGGIDAIEDLPPGTPTPDLRSLPAFDISVNRKGTQLKFAANVWNGGSSPMVVDGFRRDGEDVMDAYQYFLDEDGDQVAYQQVGTMVWHNAPSHHHWHFNDFATYELLNADKTRAVRSGKESFCLANTHAVDLTGEGAAWDAYSEDLGSVCGGYDVRSIREVLSAGWGDTYEQFRAGQSFPIKNLDDGVYWVRVLANPDGTLIETDTANNESLRKIRIYTNRKGERKVRVAPVGIVKDPPIRH